jgi:hypothetical protein
VNYHLLYGCGIAVCALAYALQLYENRRLKKTLQATQDTLVYIMLAAGGKVVLMEKEEPRDKQTPPTH